VYKLGLLFASSWLGILGARIIDRLGKGIRTAPRDVLISESSNKENMGKAFGLHKALDMFGAGLGILIIYLLMRGSQGVYNFKLLFALSMIPAAIGLVMFVFVKEKKQKIDMKTNRLPFWIYINQIDGQLKMYLVVVFLFTLGNSSKAFMILKASDAGFADINVILLFMIFHIVAAVLSVPMGKLSDKIGRKNLLIPGYITFTICYLGFAFADTTAAMVTVFVLYGIYTAMIAGVERAFVAEIAPSQLKGTMLGLHSTVAGIALLPASVIAGILWTAFGSAVPFIFGACMSLLAALLLLVFMKGRKTKLTSFLNKA
jgi:MFS family permease